MTSTARSIRGSSGLGRMVSMMALVLLLSIVTSCAPAPSTAVAPAASAGIVRTDLGTTLPGTAPGQRLGLWHYTIPAGSALVPHRHPGWQIARIVAGTLTYTI